MRFFKTWKIVLQGIPGDRESQAVVDPPPAASTGAPQSSVAAAAATTTATTTTTSSGGKVDSFYGEEMAQIFSVK